LIIGYWYLGIIDTWFWVSLILGYWYLGIIETWFWISLILGYWYLGIIDTWFWVSSILGFGVSLIRKSAPNFGVSARKQGKVNA